MITIRRHEYYTVVWRMASAQICGWGRGRFELLSDAFYIADSGRDVQEHVSVRIFIHSI